MTDAPFELTVNAATGEQTKRTLTNEEIADRNALPNDYPQETPPE